jgi:hypothetical protein
MIEKPRGSFKTSLIRDGVPVIHLYKSITMCGWPMAVKLVASKGRNGVVQSVGAA